MVQLFYDIYSAQKHTVTFEVFFTGNQNITVSPYCFRLFAHMGMPRPRHVGSFCAFSAPKHVRRKTAKHKNQMEKKNATCLIPLTPPGEKHKSPRAHRKKAKTRDTETEKTLRRLLRRVRIAHKQHKRTEDGSVSSKPGSENLRFLVAEREQKKKTTSHNKKKKSEDDVRGDGASADVRARRRPGAHGRGGRLVCAPVFVRSQRRPDARHHTGGVPRGRRTR